MSSWTGATCFLSACWLVLSVGALIQSRTIKLLAQAIVVLSARVRELEDRRF